MLTHDEVMAKVALVTAVDIFNEVGGLRERVATLSRDKDQYADAIAILSDAKIGLEELVATLRADLDRAYGRINQLEGDLSNTQSRLVDEQRLSGQHWSDLTNTRERLEHTEFDLAERTIERDDTRATLAEKEAVLSRLYVALGLPFPSPAPVVAPAPSPQPMTPEPEVLPNPFSSSSPSPSPTPEPSWPEPSRSWMSDL